MKALKGPKGPRKYLFQAKAHFASSRVWNEKRFIKFNLPNQHNIFGHYEAESFHYLYIRLTSKIT